jgi:hypothetical protein
MGLKIWPGYSYRMRQVEAGLFLQIKSQHEVVRTQQSVLDELLLIKEVNESKGVEYAPDMSDYICG